MGCDIHMFAEVKIKRRDNKTEWMTIGKVFKDHYYKSNQPTYMTTYGDEKSESAYEWNNKLSMHPYDSRNYDVFAMLADVRNGYGFAGSDTGDGFVPIAQPKGVPEDASDYYKKVVDEWGEDGHSHSYFTMEELDAYDFNQTTKHRGWVGKDQYKVFQKKGRPEMWSGGVDGNGIRHLTNRKMENYIGGKLKLEEGVVPYTQVEWEESYMESAKWFLEDMKQVKRLKRLKGVKDVRIVFFFDN